jgi:Chaperone for flagella basal body P-ring formation
MASRNLMMVQTKLRALLAIVLVGVPAVRAAGVSQRPTLKSSFEAHSDFVTLSDLLPSPASESLRARAEGITVAGSPLPGLHRILGRRQIERALREVPDIRSSLDIPPAIDITRWSRPLTREEVFAAVRDAFHTNDLPGADSLSLANMAFTSPVVTEEVPTLKVVRIEPSRSGANTRVRVWTSSEPRIPPFWVTLAGDTKPAGHPAAAQLPSADSSSRADAVAIQALQTHHPDLLDPLVVIKTGKPIQLILQGTGMKITTPGVSLDLGRQGQKIRVRASLTGKILVGTVTSPQTVEVRY